MPGLWREGREEEAGAFAEWGRGRAWASPRGDEGATDAQRISADGILAVCRERWQGGRQPTGPAGADEGFGGFSERAGVF